MNLNEARIGLVLAGLTLAVNLWMAIQNRKPRPKGKHRKKRK